MDGGLRSHETCALRFQHLPLMASPDSLGCVCASVHRHTTMSQVSYRVNVHSAIILALWLLWSALGGGSVCARAQNERVAT